MTQPHFATYSQCREFVEEAEEELQFWEALDEEHPLLLEPEPES